MSKVNYVFFGTDEFSVTVLDELEKAGFTPSLIVTAPDAPKGRGLKLTPPPIKVWGESMRINVLQPEKLDSSFASQLSKVKCQLFIVASYGKIIPKNILDIPQHGTLNVHPSLLPLFRGPSPIHSQILACPVAPDRSRGGTGENTRVIGATIMLMDEKVDHGPIVAQKELGIKIYDLRFKNLRNELAKLGGQLLVETIPKWCAGETKPREQNHEKATYTKKVKKEDGLIDLGGDPQLNYRKFLAYTPWPSVYFMHDGKRVKITDAELKTNPLRSGLSPLRATRPDLQFIIKKVIPEGKREMDYSAFEKIKKPAE